MNPYGETEPPDERGVTLPGTGRTTRDESANRFRFTGDAVAAREIRERTLFLEWLDAREKAT